MIRRFFRHIREGFYGVGRHLSMAFSSATAMAVTLALVSAFFMVMANLTSITKEIEKEVQISVLVDYDHEEASVEEAIGDQIRAIDGVSSVEFFTKDQEAQYYFENFSETDAAIVELIKEDNPLNDAFYVKVSDGQQLDIIAKQIESIEGVLTVNYGGASVVSFMEVLKLVRYVGIVMVSVLLILTVFLIQNTIRLTIDARRDEISIMKNVGAKHGYIRAPFLVEGIIIGVIGSLIPIIVTIFGYIYIYKMTGGVVLSNIFILIPPHPFVIYVSLGLLLIAVVVGFIGSFLSVTKNLRFTR